MQMFHEGLWSLLLLLTRHVARVARSDRTDVVGELRTAEEQVDELRVLCEAYTRSLEKCLHTHTTPDEKKLRKVPEYQAAETLKEALATLPPTDNPEHQDLLRTVVGRVVELQQALGMRQVEYEEHVEKQVLHPLTHLIKDDFPSVAKQKKQLKQGAKSGERSGQFTPIREISRPGKDSLGKSIEILANVGLDVDAAKTRWRALTTATAPGPTAKMDTYREELEDAETKLDQTRVRAWRGLGGCLTPPRLENFHFFWAPGPGEVSKFTSGAYIACRGSPLQPPGHHFGGGLLPEVQTRWMPPF
ncbi:Rho GTPase-activating protein 17 [Chionoecetes opilio]|uniref:Rho GTPase-activating protein 17 n=1 Tax=Chionoecetes opilio TaxID=41210 RepID=A0A8J4YJM8_CHIOP|nr:Rho GTPase-activating protein 17 [Chionoecetes opilio]